MTYPPKDTPEEIDARFKREWLPWRTRDELFLDGPPSMLVMPRGDGNESALSRALSWDDRLTAEDELRS
jgi:hypothetical protein